MIKDPELDILVETLETRSDVTIAEYDGVAHALVFLLPDMAGNIVKPEELTTTDGAMHVADLAYPNWSVHIHGRANNKDGHWACSLRENDQRDDDAYLGSGRSPVLSQAVLAAVLRLAILKAK